MLSTRQRILALALASVGAFAWWLHQDEEALGPEEGDRERRPDYTVDHFSVTTMDESGAPHRHLTAIELRHYADDNSKELETPEVTLCVKTGPPWWLRSETAWISGDNNLIHMQGKVHVDRVAGPTTRPVQMKTRAMLLKRNENYAQTDQPMRITSKADWITSGNGAEAWLKEKLRVKLTGPVRGEMITPRAGQENAPPGTVDIYRPGSDCGPFSR